MLSRKQLEQQAAALDPRDGFHAYRAVNGSEVSLHLVFRQGGQPVCPPWWPDQAQPFLTLWVKNQPNDFELGELSRLELLAESLCRFLNSGGAWMQLEAAVRALWKCSQGTLAVELAPGYQLIDSSLSTEGVYEHVFAAEGPWALRWVEGEFFDVTSLQEIKAENQQEAADAGILADQPPDGQSPGRLESDADHGPPPPADGEGPGQLP